jgi:hypothetical protein
LRWKERSKALSDSVQKEKSLHELPPLESDPWIAAPVLDRDNFISAPSFHEPSDTNKTPEVLAFSSLLFFSSNN